MTKSKCAFLFNLEKIIGEDSHAFFWTFTFPDLPDFPEVRERWRRLLIALGREEQDLFGVRVYELHETHGIHLHAVFNQYLRVEPVRRLAERCGFGRIHVKKLPREAAGYLAKYLGKQHRTEWLKGQRLWAAFGKFPQGATRVKDIEVDSEFTRAVKFCQAELKVTKLPFPLVTALQRFPTDDPAKLKLVCAMLKKSGPYYRDFLRVLSA